MLSHYFLGLLIGVCLITSGLSAQDNTNNLSNFNQCGADIAHEQLRAEDPAFRRRDDALNERWAKLPDQLPKQNVLYTIPVVFHIVHDGDRGYLSDEDLEQSLGFLNQAFSNEGYYDQGRGQDTRMRFCRAQRTPENEPTNGIIRLEATLDSLEDGTGLINLWDRDRYLNISIVPEISGGIIGRGSPGNVILRTYLFQRVEPGIGALAHEVGHAFNLRHTFGGRNCKNDDCRRNGDQICDTPPDAGDSYIPCQDSINSCHTDTLSGFATDQNDMFFNYMDYSNIECYSAFSPGQIARMHFILEGSQATIANNLSCLPPCPDPITASVNFIDTIVEVGSTLHFASETTNATTYRWRDNGTLFSNSSATSRTFTEEGDRYITLLVAGDRSDCYPDSIRRLVSVRCSPLPDFGQSSFTVNLGDTVNFAATAPGPYTYAWSVNDHPSGSSPSFSTTFDTLGIFTICLKVSSDACEQESCSYVLARSPDCLPPDCLPDNFSDCGGQQYIQLLPDPLVETFVYTTSIVKGGDQFYVAGLWPQGAIIFALSEQGTVRWRRDVPVIPSNAAAIVLDMVVDEANNVTGVGYYANDKGGIVLQLASDGRINWARQFTEEDSQIHFQRISSSRDKYHIYGTRSTSSDGQDRRNLNLSVAKSSGMSVDTANILNSTAQTSDQTGLVDTLTGNSYLCYAKNPAFPNPGSIILSQYDVNGQALISYEYAHQNNVYCDYNNVQLFAFREGLVITATRATPEQETTVIYRLNASGEIVWAKEINDRQSISDILESENGMMILATHPETYEIVVDFFTPEGNPVWSRHYPLVQNFFNNRSKFLPAEDGTIYLAADQFSVGEFNMGIVRLNPTVEKATDCVPFTEIGLTIQSFQARVKQIQVSKEKVVLNVAEIDMLESPHFPIILFCSDTCRTEICDNQFDDDNDGLTDCDDPDLAENCCCRSAIPPQIGPDSLNCITFPYLLEADTSFTAYSWSDGTTADSLWAREDGQYWFSATDACGNVSRDTVFLTADCTTSTNNPSDQADFYIPTAFSPNGDGYNDRFQIYGQQVAEIISLGIYDRFGRSLYQRKSLRPSDTEAQWDGTYPSGKPASTGVYLLQLELRLLNGEIVRQVGSISLLR